MTETTVTPSSSQPLKILRLPDLCDKVGLKSSAIYEMVKAGEFPAPVKLTKRSSGWIESEANEWLLKKSEQRR